MKQFSLILITIALCIGTSTNVLAQKNLKTVEIKTSVNIEKSKEIVEKALAFEKGVKNFEFKKESSVVVVTYQENKTTPEKIRKAISKSGFDADNVKADPNAVKLLPKECKTSCCPPKKTSCCPKKI